MKKYLSVILEIILTACLVACGSSNKDSVNDDKQEVRLGKMNMPEREVVELLSNGDVRIKNFEKNEITVFLYEELDRF